MYGETEQVLYQICEILLAPDLTDSGADPKFIQIRQIWDDLVEDLIVSMVYQRNDKY